MKKVFLAFIGLILSLVITPYAFATGTLTSTSTEVGQTVDFDAKLDFSYCDPNQQTFELPNSYLEAEALDGQPYPLDFSQANISVKVNGTEVPGYTYYRFQDSLVWFPYQIPLTVTRNDSPEIIVTGAKILYAGRVGFDAYFHQNPDWSECITLRDRSYYPYPPYNNILNFTNAPAPSPTPTPDTQAPYLSITSPQDGSQVRKKSTVNISADAYDQSGIQKVDFYVNNQLICSDTTANYSCSWNVPNGKPATYLLKAQAVDSVGNISTSTISVKSN